MTTSYNGWPRLEPGSGLLHKWIIPGTGRHFVCRNGSAGFLLAHFALWFHERVERLGDDIWDDWAYADRTVRGSETVVSNHASGTAVDLNATRHPLGRAGTFTPKQAASIRLRLKLYRGAIAWGGDYRFRKDEMHFEIDKPLPSVERLARVLMKTPRGKRILSANPGQRGVILS